MEMIKEDKFPLVTVIAACYNQEQFVVESLESIMAQTYSNIELIIWDDCSKDNSVKVIEDWIEKNHIACRFIKHTENKGICKSLNEAFSYAKGKYLQIIALDDILLPSKIERHVKLLESSNANIALVFSDAYLIDSESNLQLDKFIELHKAYFSIQVGNFIDELFQGNFIPAMSVLYKVDILKNNGKWDENLAFEDYDMMLRLAVNYEFLFDSECSVKYRLHDLNTHKTINPSEIKFTQFQMFLKHIDNDRAYKITTDIIKWAYINGGKELKKISKLYFSKVKPKGLVMYCIYLGIPVDFYRVIKRIV
jgi:glycosyltransferase involved in cell wall biosynthesis